MSRILVILCLWFLLLGASRSSLAPYIQQSEEDRKANEGASIVDLFGGEEVVKKLFEIHEEEMLKTLTAFREINFREDIPAEMTETEKRLFYRGA